MSKNPPGLVSVLVEREIEREIAQKKHMEVVAIFPAQTALPNRGSLSPVSVIKLEYVGMKKKIHFVILIF